MADPEKIGKYQIQSVLGKGAMGVVYKAFDPGIERVVAIKTVRKDLVDADLAEQLMGRFKNEAKAAGRLLHPNIVSVYEYGEDETNAFIVMEYVAGTGLREYLSRNASFDLGQIVSIMTQLLQALEFAHDRGVVHRDVKPANLILTEGGSLKVADFGIARIDTSNLTTVGMVMGTPSYMSPEQCRGLTVDRRSDLFSAGVVFYELLTGEKPFGGAMETIAYKICHEPARPPSTISRLNVSSGIDSVLALALEKDPASRFQNARAFSRALRQAYDAQTGASIDTALEATTVNVATVKMQAPAAPEWEDTVLRTVERQLAQYVGPMAKVMIRKAAARAADVTQLCSLLSENIVDPDGRRRFVEAMRSTGTGFGSGAQTSTGGASQTSPSQLRSRSTGAYARMTPLEQSFVDQSTTRLAVYLGPIAKVVAKKAAARAGSQQEFVQIVAGHLGAQERGAFLREIGFEES
jgi:tRNA A-37 threonylcarbamoyl transferase component Bud32